MGYPFATAALGPLLFAQGATCAASRRGCPSRRPRDGVAGDPPLRVLVVGDSAAAGVGVATQRDALSGQLASALAATHRVSWKLLARTGLTTQELVDWLAAEPAEPFDVAVTSLGVNDVTDGVPPGRWQAQQAELVRLLAARFRVGHAILSAVPPMERFPALPPARVVSRAAREAAQHGTRRVGRHAAALHVPARGAAARAPPDGHRRLPPRRNRLRGVGRAVAAAVLRRATV